MSAPNEHEQMQAYLKHIKDKGLPLRSEQKRLIAELEAQGSGSSNVLNTWSTASATHILLKGDDARVQAEWLLEQISTGCQTFAEAARSLSECPSGTRAGGSLGSFGPGAMVPAFDEVVFSPSTVLGKVYLVDTQFGTHLLRVDERSATRGGGGLIEGGSEPGWAPETGSSRSDAVASTFPPSLAAAGFEAGCGWDDSCSVEEEGEGEAALTVESAVESAADSAAGLAADSTADSAVESAVESAATSAAASAVDSAASTDSDSAQPVVPFVPALQTGELDAATRSTAPCAIAEPQSASAARIWDLQLGERRRAELLLGKKARGDVLSSDEITELRKRLAELVYTLTLSLQD